MFTTHDHPHLVGPRSAWAGSRWAVTASTEESPTRTFLKLDDFK